jgi:hypothetical protein
LLTANSAFAASFSRERSTTDPRDLLRPRDSGSASAPVEGDLEGCAGMCPSCRGANWSCFRLVDFLAVRSSGLLSVSFAAPARRQCSMGWQHMSVRHLKLVRSSQVKSSLIDSKSTEVSKGEHTALVRRFDVFFGAKLRNSRHINGIN